MKAAKRPKTGPSMDPKGSPDQKEPEGTCGVRPAPFPQATGPVVTGPLRSPKAPHEEIQHKLGIHSRQCKNKASSLRPSPSNTE